MAKSNKVGDAMTPSLIPCSRSAHDRSVLAWDKSSSRLASLSWRSGRARGWTGENVAHRSCAAYLLEWY